MGGRCTTILSGKEHRPSTLLLRYEVARLHQLSAVSQRSLADGPDEGYILATDPRRRLNYWTLCLPENSAASPVFFDETVGDHELRK
jgi:hypothetical protein